MQQTELIVGGTVVALIVTWRMRKMHNLDRLSVTLCCGASAVIGYRARPVSEHKVVDLSQADDAAWIAHHNTLAKKDQGPLVQLWFSSRAAQQERKVVVTDLFNHFGYDKRQLNEEWVVPLIVRSIPEFSDICRAPLQAVDIAKACESLQIDTDTITREIGKAVAGQLHDSICSMMKNTNDDRQISGKTIKKAKLRRQILWHYLRGIGDYSPWTLADFRQAFSYSEIYHFDLPLRRSILAHLHNKELLDDDGLEALLQSLRVPGTALQDTMKKLRRKEKVSVEVIPAEV